MTKELKTGGIFPELDGSKRIRRLSPVVEVVGLGVLGAGCALTYVCLELGQSPRSVYQILSGASWEMLESIREKNKKFQEDV
ncbi:MAG TPA: hypothetical protein VIK81_03130 [Patescibacteria group bacterium]